MDSKKKEKEYMIISFSLLIFTASSPLLPVFVLQKALLKSQTQTGKIDVTNKSAVWNMNINGNS